MTAWQESEQDSMIFHHVAASLKNAMFLYNDHETLFDSSLSSDHHRLDDPHHNAFVEYPAEEHHHQSTQHFGSSSEHSSLFFAVEHQEEDDETMMASDGQHFAALHYQDVEQAGPAAPALEFPTPCIHPGETIPTLDALDHTTDRIHQVKNALVRRISSSSSSSSETATSPRRRAYMMKRKLAKTTFGSVRLCVVLKPCQDAETIGAEWESTDELVAIKITSWSKLKQQSRGSTNTTANGSSGSGRKDPMKEVAALQWLGRHDHVQECLEVLSTSDYLYTVIPYCPGGTLQSKMEQVRVKGNSSASVEDSARALFTQLCRGLLHLQKKGVCHGNLCLDNILLTSNKNHQEHDQLVISDLAHALRIPYTDHNNGGGYVSDVSMGGVRRLVLASPERRTSNVGNPSNNSDTKNAGNNSTSTSCGNANNCCNAMYVAPERRASNKNDSAGASRGGVAIFDGFAIDLWSAGVILFTLLVGMAPFATSDCSDARFVQICRGGKLAKVLKSLKIPLSQSATDLLQNMLWADPRKRLCMAQVLQHPWMKGQTTTGPSSSGSSPRKVRGGGIRRVGSGRRRRSHSDLPAAAVSHLGGGGEGGAILARGARDDDRRCRHLSEIPSVVEWTDVDQYQEQQQQQQGPFADHSTGTISEHHLESLDSL